ncbi:acid phosphatase [Acidicapsa ligni]|uniref:acid phosphatase n=1 Tax=Acidicapsa ligni TaxID=542300 RepID=UPI0021E07BA0|nr:phosphatase PAP2 family protein [Acidicapsa ligni]
MRQKCLTASLAILMISTCLYGQTSSATSPATKATSKASSIHSAYYLQSLSLHLDLILPLPPAKSSDTTTTELAELHRIEASRTPEQVAQAQADDHEQDIFIFRTVMGPDFSAESLPITAALSAHVHQDEGAAADPLKSIYRRSRPYQVDNTLHPVCALTSEPTSYPSGHSLSGYLLAFTLVQIVPEKRQQIFDRADEYAHNRLVCGVHYASDTEASRKTAYAVFGSLMASPRFQQDLAAAREETRRKLGLSPSAPLQ